MFWRVVFTLVLSTLFVGCAGNESIAPLASNHPANCCALESRVSPPSRTLAFDNADDASTAAKAPGGTGHDMHGMNHSTPATQPATTQAAYTCVMHPEVVSDKPGKCPKCAMKLVAKKNAKNSDHAGHQ
jgi:hypothetical protein